MKIEPGNQGVANVKHPLVLPIWKSATSVSLMLDKKAKSALSLRLWSEDITPVSSKKPAAESGQSNERVEGDLDNGDDVGEGASKQDEEMAEGEGTVDPAS
ncbi:hypothetical protein FRC08_018061 [Ceratobasidium sp. 394]|nr:hypothetical protein FRC08_018061 [Ceratobasidium sp. 394]